MSHSPISCHVDPLQPGLFKRKRDQTIADEEDLGSPSGNDILIPDMSYHIHNEIDLEVAIRERLASTIEGRIQWALQLLDALSNVKEQQGQPLDGDDFQDAALDALDAFEAPSTFIFDTGLSDEGPPSPSSLAPSAANQHAIQRAPPPKTRSSRTPKLSQQQKKRLYIKFPSSTSHNQLAILACPICGRTDFTTLQGLLNHARLSHGVEWASHDACITACAIPVSADERTWEVYEQEGVEVPWGGSVVGLRRLFERAVGVDGGQPGLPSTFVGPETSLGQLTSAPSTLLSRTLGLHADSPALAHFLGRAPKRRCINVHDEGQDVDITTIDDRSSPAGETVSEAEKQPKNSFRMQYPHRSTARQDLDLVVDVHGGADAGGVNEVSDSAILPVGTTSSRFHIMARIHLEDRSLFLTEARRTQLSTSDQYRWILAATAPSYSLPLASFLRCVTVVSPKTVSPVFLSVQQQPFAVTGTASEPFMAKVIFEWVGGGKMEVEHWVELDQSKSSASVAGSEQLLDVELDRNTQLLPAPKGNPPPLPSLDRQFPLDSSQPNASQSASEQRSTPTTKEESYEPVLKTLLPRVPMTMKDVKPRITVQVPYKLVTSPNQLLALVPGRRKAIEWGRARALHSLYVEHLASLPPSRRTPLTVGDVYMFLEDNSHFPRPSLPTPVLSPEPKKRGKEKEATPTLGEEACPVCGIKKRLHPGYNVKNEDDAVRWTCALVSAMEQRFGINFPLHNLTKLLPWQDDLHQAMRARQLPSRNTEQIRPLNSLPPICRSTPRDLVTLNPPDLVLAVHRNVARLRLSTFPSFPLSQQHPALFPKREQVEHCLAPAALLSAMLKPFISTLLRSAIETAKRDATAVSSAAPIVAGSKSGRSKRSKKLVLVLTPGHILRGLRSQLPVSFKAGTSTGRSGPGLDASSNPRARESVLLGLTRVAVPLDFGKDATAAGSGSHGIEIEPPPVGPMNIKAEPV